MANMIGFAPSNESYDFNAYDATGKIWNGSAYVTEATADYLSYRIAATKGSNASAADIDAPFSAAAPANAVQYVMRIRKASLSASYIVWQDPITEAAQSDTVAAIVAGVYDSLAGIQPTVSLTFDPRTMTIRLVDGDDWLEEVRTIDIPITLPDVVTDLAKCTATFGAVKGSTRIDRVAEVIDIEGEPHVRLTFQRADTLGKQSGRYSWDARVQYTESLVTSTITVYSGVLELVKGIAKLPGEIT